jgi:hypothetical protein
VVLERTDNNDSQEAQDGNNDKEREQGQRQDHNHDHTCTTPAYSNTNHRNDTQPETRNSEQKAMKMMTATDGRGAVSPTPSKHQLPPLYLCH